MKGPGRIRTEEEDTRIEFVFILEVNVHVLPVQKWLSFQLQ